MSSSKQKSSDSKKLRQTTMGNYTTSESGSRTTRSSRHNWGNYSSNFTGSFFANASKKDTEQYRKGYPGKKDDPKQNDNLLFYTNQMASYPDGDFIDNIHKKWWGDYGRLEVHHGYIQWIFPIRESGMNWHAQELQLHEAKAIMEDPKAKVRVLKSYKMMLNFYGMVLEDEKTGHIVRGEDYKHRFAHLNRSYHNYLRITRMLKSLGELGYEHLKKPFVEFVLEEALEKETLTNCVDSCYKYWLETIKDDKDRENLKDYVQKMEDGYGTEHPPGDNKYESDEMAEGGHDDGGGDMYDEDSLEARHLQEKEDRLIAMNEQFKEDMLGGKRSRKFAHEKTYLQKQENRLNESKEEKMDIDDTNTCSNSEQTTDVAKQEIQGLSNSQEKENTSAQAVNGSDIVDKNKLADLDQID